MIFDVDSYKHSHFMQYPPEMKYASVYGEARINNFSHRMIFFGLQPTLMDSMDAPDLDMIEECADVLAAHGIPFNDKGFRDLENLGYLPLEIRALPEGIAVPCGTPLFEVVNTDPRFPWLPNFIDTDLTRTTWYPSTVATLSAKCRKIIYRGLLISSDDPDGQIEFKLHDMGARGASSRESAALGGMAHLLNFSSTDTLAGILHAQHYYKAGMPGFNIPAAEHSTITSWGREREYNAYHHILKSFPDGLVSIVSDSYDLERAVRKAWCYSLKEEILERNGTLVVRPDSGNPTTVSIDIMHKLWEAFGGTVNSKGYRVLDSHVRVIQGDGMNEDSIEELIRNIIHAGFSLDNIVFGMGGGLLQKVDRDTLSFAMKMNAVNYGDGWRDVQKTPTGSIQKASKAGRQSVIEYDGQYRAIRTDHLSHHAVDLMQPVWRDGELLVKHTFDEVRNRAKDF